MYLQIEKKMLIGDFIYALHPVVLGCMVVGITVSVSLITVLFCRRFIRIVETEDDTFKIETYSDAFGIAFAILLGLIIVTAWTSYDQTDDLVKRETAAISDLYQLSEYMDPLTQNELRKNLKDYVNYVVEKEWPLLPLGKAGAGGDDYLFHNLHILYQFMPSNKKEESVQAEVNKLSTLILDKRRSRNLNAQSSLPPIMWLILISSNLIAFIILGLAIEGPLSLHIILQTLFAIGTGLMLLLVIVLDRPFYNAGGGISSEPFKKLLLEWEQKENKTGPEHRHNRRTR